MYNAGRLRPGDRLNLSWKRPGDRTPGMEIRDGGIFEVQAVAEEGGSGVGGRGLPPGYAWATLLPITDPGGGPADERSRGRRAEASSSANGRSSSP